MAEYMLDGSVVDGIEELYAEFNRLFMADEDWQLGPSLDGLNDVLYRVESTGGGHARIVWTDHAHAQEALGSEATERWLRAKLARPDVFNPALIRQQLDDLLAGRGRTYFELVLEVFADHPGIELDLR